MIKNFQEFLNEGRRARRTSLSLEVNTMTDITKAFNVIFREAKNSGLLKAFKACNSWNYRDIWRNRELYDMGLKPGPDTSAGVRIHFYKTVFAGNQYAEIYFIENNQDRERTILSDNYDRRYELVTLAVWKDNNLTATEVEKLFVDFKGTLKDSIWEMKREDFKVTDLEKLIRKTVPKKFKDGSRVNMRCYKYASDAAKSLEKITVADIQTTPEYKSLVTGPIRLVSSPKQLKQKNLVFGFDANYFWSRNKHYFYFPDEKFLREGYSLSNSGYVRMTPLFGGSEPRLLSNFNATSLSGWRQGLVKIKSLFEKFIEDEKKNGAEFYMTPEEVHKNRGKITGGKFGL